MRIIVEPDELRAFAQQLRSVSSELRNVASRVGSAANNLDWEARNRIGMDSQINNARNQAYGAANLADELARYLDGKAQGFTEADQQGVTGIGDVASVFSALNQGWMDLFQYVSFPAKDIRNYLSVLGGLLGKVPSTIGGFVVVPISLVAMNPATKDLLKTGPGWLSTRMSDGYKWTVSTVRSGYDAFLKGVDDEVTRNDRSFEKSLSHMLQPKTQGSTETLRYGIKGDVTIPALEIGIPGSGKAIAAGQAVVKRNPDGTYTLTLIGDAGAGLREDVGLKGKVHLGSLKAKLEAGGEVINKQTVEISYKFDPKIHGDMTKMDAFLGGLGLPLSPNSFGKNVNLTGELIGQARPVLVAPSLIALKDNFEGVKVGSGIDSQIGVGASALINIAGVKADASLMGGQGLAKSADGHWQSIAYSESKIGSEASIFVAERQLTGTRTLEQMTDSQAHQSSLKATLEITQSAGGDLGISDIKKLLPKVALDTTFKSDAFQKMTIEYRIDNPNDHVRQMMESGDYLGLAKQPGVSMDIRGTSGIRNEVGLGAEMGGVTQTIGGDVTASNERESEVTLYSGGSI